MIARAYFLSALILLSAPLPALAAAAGDTLVVVEVRGAALQPGQEVDGAQKMTLLDGQLVTLLSQTGQMIKLRGPMDGPPLAGASAEGPTTMAALEALVTQKLTRVEKAGVVRAGPGQVVPPDPWLIDVSRSGSRCLPQGAAIMLWRPSAVTAEPLIISPGDCSWRAQVQLAAGEDRAPLPRAVPVRARATYAATLGGKAATLTLHSIPPAITTGAMRAAWMSEMGCDGQALALMKTLDKNGAEKSRPEKKSDDQKSDGKKGGKHGG